MFWVPLPFHRILLKSSGLQNRSEPIHKAIASSIWRAYSNVQLRRQFTNSRTLENDSNTTSEGTTTVLTPPTPRRQLRRIATLDPAKLDPSDYIDFSSKIKPALRVVLRTTDPDNSRSARGPDFEAVEWSSRRFPLGTRGFMYYYVPPHSSPLAGELRFRLTSSPDPTGFAAGSDLLAECGMPWRFPLYKVVGRNNFREIPALLLQDGLVSQRTVDLVTTAVASESLRIGVDVAKTLFTVPVLSAFGQEFLFHFGINRRCQFLFVGADAILRQNLKYDRALGGWVREAQANVEYSPFQGSAICCFEQSNLPEHIGKRVVVIRIKRFVDNDPIRHIPDPGDLGSFYPIEELRPREGELVKKMTNHRYVRLWAVDVDKQWRRNMAQERALKVLFENAELYGSPRESDI